MVGFVDVLMELLASTRGYAFFGAYHAVPLQNVEKTLPIGSKTREEVRLQFLAVDKLHIRLFNLSSLIGQTIERLIQKRK